jgi:hypothetical protein
MRPAYQRHLIAIVAAVALGVAGCDQQQPIAQKPAPDPGFKQGETPPIEPDKGPQRNRDGNVPLPAATAPTTPGEQNSPGAPVVPLSPTPQPIPSPSEAPATSRQVPP